MNDAARIRARDRWRARWPLVLTFAAGALAYANTLGHGFVWDDLIILDQRIRWFRSPLDAFLLPADIQGFPGVFRPVTFASLWLDQLSWWRNALGFHLTSVLLHALNGALVYAVACAVGCQMWAAVAGALLFAVHPIHTEAVAWVTARADVLVTTFVLLTILAFLRLRRVPAAHARATLGWAAAIGLCSFLAAASKEPGAVVPLLVAVAATIPLAAPTAVSGSRPPWIAVGAATVGVVGYLVLRALSGTEAGSYLSTIDVSTAFRLFGAFGFYVARLVWPFGLRPYQPDVPGGALVVFLGAVAIAVAAALVFGRAVRARFAIVWLLVTLAPSLLVAVSDLLVTPVSERYLYLPSVGLALLVAVALPDGVRPHERAMSVRHRAVAVAYGMALSILAIATVRQNRVWRDEITLWTAVTRDQQAFALPYLNLGFALAEVGRLDEAESAYRAGLAARGGATVVRDLYVDLGHLELQRQHLDEALTAFTRANAIAPHASAYYGMGAVYRARARAAAAAGDTTKAAETFARARDALEAALRINVRHYKSQYLLAGVLYETGDLAGALERYRTVAALAPDTDLGARSAQNARDLAAWLADPSHDVAATR